uniref:Putative LOC101856368 [Aplysia californica] n=1 Tax=Lepeophtheirus salmonis TaxID=72036 RepID=A0A0K2TRW7_LEPSM
MVEVEDRTAATLLLIFAKYVEPGSIFMSGNWPSYRRVHFLGMQHFTVVHKRNYVDPLIGAHTHTIESLLSRVKGKMHKLGAFNTSGDLFPAYLSQYMGRKKFSRDKHFGSYY